MRAARPEELRRYGWLGEDARVRALDESFPAPPGFRRATVKPGSFGAWLRGLPLRAPGTPVLSYRGEVIRAGDDANVAAVAELDVGQRDLQQCADSIMRLYAEWLWSEGRRSEIAFPLTSGVASWPDFAEGSRPSFDGPRITWSRRSKPDASRAAFARYLDVVYGWAGTATLGQHAVKVPLDEIAAGDFLLQPGSPGHVVLVLDLAEAEDGRRAVLVGEGFMPAQDFHLIAPSSGDTRPWYPIAGDALKTPFWPAFPWTSLRRMPAPRPRT